MDEPSFRDLVNQAADDFESQREMRVTLAAREELIRPGIPHLPNVTQGINAGGITVERMQAAVRQVLERGLQIARQRTTIPPSSSNVIDDYLVRQSMDEDCPYLFWC